MRISRLAMIGAGIALAAAAPALAGGRPGASMPPPGAGMPRPGVNWNGGAHRWGTRYQGRWIGGWNAPGGWGAYRRPVYGYVLPSYWISPSYYIANYGAYGLPQPSYGYGWSRYYDDAVMTDRYGRVYDSRSDIDWGRFEGGYAPDGGYDDGYYDAPRRDNGLGGAAIGAVVGGVAGNRIAGRGNRTAGTLIGAVGGAVVGSAIDRAEDGRRHDNRRYQAPAPRRGGAGYDYGYGYADDSVTSGNEYEGRWTGTWTSADGRRTSGTYEGRFEGDVRGAGVDYAPPPYAAGGAPYRGGPAPTHWSGAPGTTVTTSYGGGYVSGGYYYGPPTVTTVTIQPAVTTTTTTTSYVTERVAYRKPVRKVRRTCTCK